MSVVALHVEVQFRRWSDSSTQGSQGTFTFESREDLEPIIGKEGKRFFMTLCEVGDDEQLVHVPQTVIPPVVSPHPEEKLPQGPLCRSLVQWCRDKRFQEFMVSRYDQDTPQTESDVAALVRRLCHVTSRHDIDHDATGETQGRFKAYIQEPWARFNSQRVAA